MEWIDLGPTPAEESCEQVGTEGYDILARAECLRYIRLLKTLFGQPPDGARFRIKSNPHDFGSYLDVEVGFDSMYPESLKYAFAVERDLPVKWSDTRKRDWKKTSDSRECPSCRGTGVLTDANGVQTDDVCPLCSGDGTDPAE